MALMLSLMLSTLTLTLFAAASGIECVPGTYWHKHGSVDCAPGGTCKNSIQTCCCACHADYYCPGGATTQPEVPCPPGSTSPPNSTSASDCSGGPPPPSGGFNQIHIAYTGRANEFSVDFVGGSGATVTLTSMDGTSWTSLPAVSFAHPTIGYMSHGLLRFPGASAEQKTYYMVGDSSGNSSVFTVLPNITRPEVFAVYGDFGFANDVCVDLYLAVAAAAPPTASRPLFAPRSRPPPAGA